MIVGNNSLLNQYVPTFFIKDLKDGQTVRYDSVRKAFVNAEGGGSGGVDRLGELLDVSDSVDNPLALQNGQALVYNSTTLLWENKFIDYNTLLNKPTIGSGSVTTVSVVTANGISGTVTNPSTTPAITLTLGNITPLSSHAVGTVSGSNLSGTNTGDQTITLTGDVTGSGTGSFATALSTTGVTAGIYTNPTITVDGKGRITSASSGSAGGVTSFNTRTGAVTLSSGDVTTALGFTPYNSSNPAGYTNNTGTVTSVTVSGSAGRVTSSGSPITGAGTITLDLATTTVTPGVYTAANITIDAYGRITSAANGTGGGGGTVTSVAAAGSNGVSISGSPITTSGTITIGLGAITPTSVAATGTVTGSNLSGTNTGDQTITLSGDATGSGTGSLALTLSTVNLTPGVYGDDHLVPTITVNNKGLVTSITTQHVDTTVRDLVPETETFIVAPRHQYIVTGVLEIDGYMINNGVIAIL